MNVIATTDKTEESHPLEDYLRVDRLPHIWCPGCGLGTILAAFIRSLMESGLDPDGITIIPLTPTERAALDDKNCDYYVQPISNVMGNHGLTFAGIEMKHRVGYSWAELRSAEEIEAYLELNEVTFSDTDIQAICGIIFKYLDILVDRKCSSSYTINVPSAADISLIEQATHTLTLSEVAAIISAYAINQVVATATATA